MNSIAGPIRSVLEWITTEFSASLSDGRVWLSFAVALLFGTVCVFGGTWVARRVGLLYADAPLGETLGVGLGSGLLVLAALWAAAFSGGRSSFTPVAVAFAVAIAVGGRRQSSEVGTGPVMTTRSVLLGRCTLGSHRSLVRVVMAAAAFVLVVGLLYGVTMAPSPRGGVQPVEFMDEAYYSILGKLLALTGTESIYSPSGFDELPGLPTQTWYHWGELWLSAAVITVSGADSLLARHYVVLPVLLLAVAALSGTIVRRLTETSSRGAYLFGAAAALCLAPLPLLGPFEVPLPGPYFATWARSLIFGVTLYGLGTIAVLLGLYSLAANVSRERWWGPSIFSGAVIASILPAHIVLAMLALVGVGGVALVQLAQSLARREWPSVGARRREALTAAAAITTATILWGILMGHGFGGSGLSVNVEPFNEAWRTSMLLLSLGGGAFLAIPAAWYVSPRKEALTARVLAGTMTLVVVGAFAWGARLGDFNMFHVFFGGLAVFATPAAAVATWTLWHALRESGRARAASALLLAAVVQFELGAASVIPRLLHFGPNDYEPIPVSLLEAIRELPTDAKIAYACNPLEEVAFWDARLLSITAHTGRPVVPMCFQAAYFDMVHGLEPSPDIVSPLFMWAPQRALYPTSDAQPTAYDVTVFLKQHGIDYIYSDAAHPNTLVAHTLPVATTGDFEILYVPFDG